MATKKRKPLSTFEKEMENPEFQKLFKEEKDALAVSELLCELMEDEAISVRSLANQAGLAPSTIQKIRDGSVKNTTISSIKSILNILGYKIIIKKKRKEYVLA